MPGWVQVVVGIAAFLTAMGVIWRVAIRPGARIISQAEETLPLLAELVKQWTGTPNLPAVLKAIAEQFQTDSGSSLRDAINRLEVAAADNQAAAEENHQAALVLNRQFEVERALVARDRDVTDRLVALVHVLNARLTVGNEGIANIQTEQHGVAHDLAESIDRADLEDRSTPGASADAALRSTDEQRADTKERHPE